MYQIFTFSLFSLMRVKSLSDNHITEIIRAACVARVSFYRDYASKEDMLVTLIRDVLDDFRTHLRHEQESFYTYRNILRGGGFGLLF